MKKILLSIALVSAFAFSFGQSYSPAKNKKERTDDFSISVKEMDREKIDWGFAEEFFADKKPNDSIQFAVTILPTQKKNLKSEKKYTVRGEKKNLNELVATLRNLIK